MYQWCLLVQNGNLCKIITSNLAKMKISEFEKAIKSLGMIITIDNFKLNEGNVYQVTGHTDEFIIVWDGNGKAFTACRDCEESIFLVHENDDTLQAAKGVPIERDSSFDLNSD